MGNDTKVKYLPLQPYQKQYQPLFSITVGIKRHHVRLNEEE